MKVKELIEKLQAYPLDYEINIEDACCEDGYPRSILDEELFLDNERVIMIYHVER